MKYAVEYEETAGYCKAFFLSTLLCLTVVWEKF